MLPQRSMHSPRYDSTQMRDETGWYTSITEKEEEEQKNNKHLFNQRIYSWRVVVN